MGKVKETAEAEERRGKRPVYNVRARQGPAADGTPSEYFSTVGAVWPWEKGDGFVLKLDFVPLNGDGSFLLVPPKDNE
jgi:hypothetical protein